VAALDNAPAYREKWNLVQDSKLQEGVVYMASLNPKEPACLVMLGLISWKNHDLNLAAAAFEKAIKLGSPQSEMLRRKTEGIRSFIQKSQQYQKGEFIRQLPAFVAIAAIVGAIILYVIGRYRRKPVS